LRRARDVAWQAERGCASPPCWNPLRVPKRRQSKELPSHTCLTHQGRHASWSVLRRRSMASAHVNNRVCVQQRRAACRSVPAGNDAPWALRRGRPAQKARAERTPSCAVCARRINGQGTHSGSSGGGRSGGVRRSCVRCSPSMLPRPKPPAYCTPLPGAPMPRPMPPPVAGMLRDAVGANAAPSVSDGHTVSSVSDDVAPDARVARQPCCARQRRRQRQAAARWWCRLRARNRRMRIFIRLCHGNPAHAARRARGPCFACSGCGTEGGHARLRGLRGLD
jgi:hypothetical protein